MTQRTGRSGPPEDRVTVEWTASFYDASARASAFVFHLPDSATRFTIHAALPDRYTVGERYTLTITALEERGLTLSAEQFRFLRHCLLTTELRWREAIDEADAGATRPRPATAPPADHLNVEPTPIGYQVIGARFRDELARVTNLRDRIGHFLHDSDADDSSW